jgi:hypothetical protein
MQFTTSPEEAQNKQTKYTIINTDATSKKSNIAILVSGNKFMPPTKTGINTGPASQVRANTGGKICKGIKSNEAFIH